MHGRLVEAGGKGVKVSRLGRDRAGEIRITRFLHNSAVSVAEMVETARARTCAQAAGRHILAIQDTTAVRIGADGKGVSLHPVIAIDALNGAVLGLVEAFFLNYKGGRRANRRKRAFAKKDSRRWHDGASSASALADAGAACVMVVGDREGDIYEDFALKPATVELLVRASQDRRLADGSHLFAPASGLDEAGLMTVELPAAPGRAARTAVLSLQFGTVEICRPKSRTGKAAARLPRSVVLTLVEAREINPPRGVTAAHWRLLTTHQVNDPADARRIVGFYRLRWTIEQLFRTLKTQGFDIEALRQAEGGPLEKLVAASLIAAITVLQLVHERDGVGKRPLADAFDPEDQPVLEQVSQSLEGKTARQKNPHPKGSLAFAAWVFARLGGWNGYYGKPGPVVMLNGLLEFQLIKHGWGLRDV